MPCYKHRRRCRGTSEIETLLVIPVFITFMLLAVAVYRLGSARISNVFNAGNEALTQVTSGQGMTASSITPTKGADDAWPTWNTRFDEAAPTQTAAFPTALKVAPFTASTRSMYLDPAWQWAGYPNGDSEKQAWFEKYEMEVSDDTVRNALLMPNPPKP